MNKGDKIQLCNCLFDIHTTHVTVTSDNEHCAFCGCVLIKRKATKDDVTQWLGYRKDLETAKWRGYFRYMKRERIKNEKRKREKEGNL